MPLSDERKAIIELYIIKEPGLKNLIDDLCLQIADEKNLQFISDALNGKFSAGKNIHALLLLKAINKAEYFAMIAKVVLNTYNYRFIPDYVNDNVIFYDLTTLNSGKNFKFLSQHLSRYQKQNELSLNKENQRITKSKLSLSTLSQKFAFFQNKINKDTDKTANLDMQPNLSSKL